MAGGRSSAGGDPKTSTFRHGVENLVCTLKRRAGYRNVCGLSWNGSGGTWWADRGIFISHEAVGEIIANSDLQDFGLEAVVNWFIFCYFSTGRKYPAVVYGSYLTFPIDKSRGFLVRQPLHSDLSLSVLHDFPKR